MGLYSGKGKTIENALNSPGVGILSIKIIRPKTVWIEENIIKAKGLKQGDTP